MMDTLFWFPFMAAGFGVMLLVAILVFIFQLWMIVDCARRTFRNVAEKVVWLLVTILGGWIGALIYLLVVRVSNPSGLIRK